MLETSKDVLYLTLSFCAIWVSVFLCWLLYYMVATIKKTHDVINFFSSTIKTINDFVEDIKEKAHGSMAYFKLFGVITEKLVDYVEKKGIVDKVVGAVKSKKTKTKNSKQK